MELLASRFDPLYVELLGRLLEEGEPVTAPPNSRQAPTRELIKVSLRLEDPRWNVLHHPARNLNYRFMVAEWLWIMFGREDVATITRYNSRLTEFSDDGLTFWGAYGPRFRAQWNYVLARLRENPASRQAVITLWRPCPGVTRDVPCTVSFQFLVRRGRLRLLAAMRSSDVWLGLPYDVFNFTMIQHVAAGVLGYPVGPFHLDLVSSHLYERDATSARDLGDTADTFTTVASPALPEFPPTNLHTALLNPQAAVTLAPPWDRYARALRASTRRAAWEVLRAP